MLTFAIFNHFREYRTDLMTNLDQYAWIPLVVIITVIVCRTFGILPIIQGLMSESYPTEIRTQSIGITQGYIFLRLCKIEKNFFTLN